MLDLLRSLAFLRAVICFYDFVKCLLVLARSCVFLLAFARFCLLLLALTRFGAFMRVVLNAFARFCAIACFFLSLL